MSIINTALIGKIKKTKADKTNVLELDNLTSFTPSADYQPATKKYVDDAVLGLSPDTNTFVESGLIDGNNLELTLNNASTVDIDISSLLDDTRVTVVDDLESVATDEALSANQGRLLDENKQDVLVSGTSIKTINGISVLGSGNIEIQGGSVSGTVYSARLTAPLSPSLGEIWFNQTTGQTYQYHEDADGTRFWLEVGSGAFTDTQYTLSESDLITVTDPLITTYSFLHYTGFVQVFVNRLKLRKTEFTSNGTSITINIDLEVGDEIEIVTLDVIQG